MDLTAVSSRKRTHASALSLAKVHPTTRNVRRKTSTSASSQPLKSAEDSSNASSPPKSERPPLSNASDASSVEDTSSSLSPPSSEDNAPSSANPSPSPNSSSSDSNDSSDPSDSDSANSATPITSLPIPRKPCIHPTNLATDGPALLDRLRGFLPQMATANRELEAERVAGTLAERSLEKVDDDGGYIEMNLGLGVLKEKDPDGENSGSDSEGEDESSDGGEEVEVNGGGREKDIMGRLMGQRRVGAGVQIQEVEDG